ncbi:MAG: response regulator, partial [Myxococcota bacterium]
LEVLVKETDFDLIITDVIMPGMNGTELAAEVGRRRPDIPVLFMSGALRDDLVGRGLLADHAAFLGKPFAPDDLLRAVRTATKRAKQQKH